jgi:hypothetical protein
MKANPMPVLPLVGSMRTLFSKIRNPHEKQILIISYEIQ